MMGRLIILSKLISIRKRLKREKRLISFLLEYLTKISESLRNLTGEREEEKREWREDFKSGG